MLHSSLTGINRLSDKFNSKLGVSKTSRRHVQLLAITTLILIVTLSIIIFTPSRQNLLYQLTPKINSFDFLISKVYGNRKLSGDLSATEPESEFNFKVKQLFTERSSTDFENVYWSMGSSTLRQTELTVPSYYSSDEETKPLVQPFDPRFTLAMYYHFLNKKMLDGMNEEVSIPFNWYDWVDMSDLHKYLLAEDDAKPGCGFVEAKEDAQRMKEYENILKEKEEAWEKEREKAEEEKKKNGNTTEDSEEEEEEEEEEDEDEEEDEEEEKDEAEVKEETKTKEEETKAKEEETKAKEEETKAKEEETKAKEEETKAKEEETKAKEEAEKANQEPEKEAKEEPVNIKDTDIEGIKDDISAVVGGDAKPKDPPTQANAEEFKKRSHQTDEETQTSKRKREDEQESANDEGAKNLEQLKTRKKEFFFKDVHGYKEFCIPDSDLPIRHDDGHKLHPGFNVHKNPGRTTSLKAKITGKSYLYSFAPPPSQVLFLTKDGSYSVSIDSNKGLLDNLLPESYVSATGNDQIDVLQEFRQLTRTHPPSSQKVMNSYLVEIPESSFHFDGGAALANLTRLEDKGIKLSNKERLYKESLEYSIEKVASGSTSKYFSEARLLGSNNGDHYDWRFFNGIVLGTKEQELTLHRLIRAWLSFSRKNGITTWIAHGSLLSWYWNGLSFPWDNDIDVQVPIMDLHNLSLNFNQTLVVEDPEDGFGRFFLDCGTFITLREKGNGLNAIDARFVDVDTGMYVDITALASSNTKPPSEYYDNHLPQGFVKGKKSFGELNKLAQIYNCRNDHFNSYDELSPLVKTVIEGEVGYIPRKYSKVLSEEYSAGMSLKVFHKHVFIPKLRLWVQEEDLYYFLKKRSKWIRYYSSQGPHKEPTAADFIDHSYEYSDQEMSLLRKGHNPYKKNSEYLFKLTNRQLEQVADFTYEDLADLLLSDKILMDFVSTREFTFFHEEEIMKLTYGKSTASLHNSGVDFPPLRYEPFLYGLRRDLDSYEEKVERIRKLIENSKRKYGAASAEPFTLEAKDGEDIE
ncbi:uncharacterized protein LODBEIA_P39670 [Lodderomyces beijingensis]|uniref:LicD/FKTN/FKRP nucleotidyltransferase domain-containing protein n=1 Tax=Lodderomyces beijingensis TaxID=1775926 RepID=A0ABP0ZNM5_9ASCO